MRPPGAIEGMNPRSKPCRRSFSTREPADHGLRATVRAGQIVPRHGRWISWAAAFGIAPVAALVLTSCAGLGAHDVGPRQAGTLPAPSVIDTGPQQATLPLRVTLLSQDQYFNLLAYLFGPDIRSVGAHFAPFIRTGGLLEVGAFSAGVSTEQVEEFQRTATAVATKVVSPEYRDFVIPCKPADPNRADEACAREFLTSVGRMLYRRPMDAALQAQVVQKANVSATRLKDFYAGLGLALEGMLMAPEVHFVIDKAEPDPARPGQWRLDAYTLASRLSLLLWDSPPDSDLLGAAQRGELSTLAGRARVVDRMLASPRLEAGVRAFFDDMLGFDDFATLAKDPIIYPDFTGLTAADAREQTLRTIADQLIVRNGDYRDLFTTTDTFISPSLASLYGVASPPGWTRYQSPPGSERVGLLTQISFLADHAHPGRSSPTRRGKALRELLLCENVPRPPPNVDFSKVENPDPSLKTMRQRLTAHRSNPVCAGCHRITDPIGLALENFDGAGEFRTTENGAPIDASGSLDGKSFTDAIGLGLVLHDDPQLPKCLVTRVYDYATGGTPRSDDKSVLSYLNQRFAAGGYRLPALLRTIALSSVFSEVTPPAASPSVAKVAGTSTAARSAGLPTHGGH